MKLVNIGDLKSPGGNTLWVQVPPVVLLKRSLTWNKENTNTIDNENWIYYITKCWDGIVLYLGLIDVALA